MECSNCDCAHAVQKIVGCMAGMIRQVWLGSVARAVRIRTYDVAFVVPLDVGFQVLQLNKSHDTQTQQVLKNLVHSGK